MKIVAIISLVIYSYGFYCLIRELIDIEKDNKLDDEHSSIHFSILIYNIVTFGTFIFWLFWHKGFNHGFYDHLINESLWLLLIMFSIIMTSTSRHLKKERLNEEYYLNIKKEIQKIKKRLNNFKKTNNETKSI